MKTHPITFTCKAADTIEPAYLRTCLQATLASSLVLPSLAMAQVGGSDATAAACGFLTSVQSLLNAVSIVVVTIAIIFSGYQIAFAHKRIADVAPVMIGAILIGAASQIAGMFLSGSSGSSACTAGIAPDATTQLATLAQRLLQHA
jgi:type IV secretion system protein VirB2